MAHPDFVHCAVHCKRYRAGLAVLGGILLEDQKNIGALPLALGTLWLILGTIPFVGLKVLKPNEALVLTCLAIHRHIAGSRLLFVHPFSVAVNPAAKPSLDKVVMYSKQSITISSDAKMDMEALGRRVSLKAMTLNNAVQKVNDCLGNPVEIGIAVIWRVVTAKAVFNVDNYKEYLSLQCDSALRNIVRRRPYDVAPNVDTTGDGEPDEGGLRGSSEEVARRIKEEIQSKVHRRGSVILEARITYLAYAQEIAAVML